MNLTLSVLCPCECLSVSCLFCVSFLAYPNLLGTKGYVVVVVVVVVLLFFKLVIIKLSTVL